MTDLRVRFPEPCDEQWEAMAPAGCDRVCARCDTVIHDLSHYDFDEAEALLRRGTKTCVRMAIGADGAVALKPGRSLRRMVIAGASAGLLAAGASACTPQPGCVIAGKAYTTVEEGVQVIATAPDGKTFRAKVKPNGEYRITHVPAGTYRLRFETACGDGGKIEKPVIVGESETVVPYHASEVGCYGLGQATIEGDMG